MNINPYDLKARVKSYLWEVELKVLPPGKVRMIRTLRLAYVLLQDIANGQLTMRATSLVYTTLLSLVPLLALSFSVLKAFGVHNQVEPLLLNFLQPLGAKGVELGTQVIGFVERVNVGVLGSIGLVLLLYTVLSLIQKIEQAFNFIWRIVSPRSLAQRFTGYLTVILIGPVLVFAALGITASVMSMALVQQLLSVEPFGTLIYMLSKFIPYVLVIGAFTLIYILIPNTNVQIGAALMGGIIAGVLWEYAGWVFASFVVTSTNYQAIYSSFAILILFLIWLYLCWLILLMGASIAFYIQHPEQVLPQKGAVSLSNRRKEALALSIMFVIAAHYCNRRPHWTFSGLVRQLGFADDAVASLLKSLREQGLLLETAQEPTTYVPARDPQTILITDILAAVRTNGEDTGVGVRYLSNVEQVNTLMDSMEKSMEDALQGRNLGALVGPDEKAVGKSVNLV